MKQFKKIILIYSLLLTFPNLFSAEGGGGTDSEKAAAATASAPSAANIKPVRLVQVDEPVNVATVDEAKKYITDQLKQENEQMLLQPLSEKTGLPAAVLKSIVLSYTIKEISDLIPDITKPVENPNGNLRALIKSSMDTFYIEKKQDDGSWRNIGTYIIKTQPIPRSRTPYINSLIWSPNGETIATASSIGTPTLFNFWKVQNDGSLLTADRKNYDYFVFNREYPNSIAFNPNGDLLAFASETELFIYNKDIKGIWKQLAKADFKSDNPSYITWNSNGTKIYLASLTKTSLGKLLGGKVYTFKLEAVEKGTK